MIVNAQNFFNNITSDRVDFWWTVSKASQYSQAVLGFWIWIYSLSSTLLFLFRRHPKHFWLFSFDLRPLWICLSWRDAKQLFINRYNIMFAFASTPRIHSIFVWTVLIINYNNCVILYEYWDSINDIMHCIIFLGITSKQSIIVHRAQCVCNAQCAELLVDIGNIEWQHILGISNKNSFRTDL